MEAVTVQAQVPQRGFVALGYPQRAVNGCQRTGANAHNMVPPRSNTDRYSKANGYEVTNTAKFHIPKTSIDHPLEGGRLLSMAPRVPGAYVRVPGPGANAAYGNSVNPIYRQPHSKPAQMPTENRRQSGYYQTNTAPAPVPGKGYPVNSTPYVGSYPTQSGQGQGNMSYPNPRTGPYVPYNPYFHFPPAPNWPPAAPFQGPPTGHGPPYPL
jgi:hypothetical protein